MRNSYNWRDKAANRRRPFSLKKKPDNSVIKQQNHKNILFSEIELTSVNWPKKGQESSFSSKKVKTGLQQQTNTKTVLGAIELKRAKN